MRSHLNSTLMELTKEELVDYIRMIERKRDVAEEALAQQAENLEGWAPVARGKWIERPYLMGTTRVCSRCGQNYGMPHGIFKFCPNCGARMLGGD